MAYSFAPAHGDIVQSDFVIQVKITQQQGFIVTAGGASSSEPVPANPAINYLYMSWNNGDFEALEIGG